jgi:hypothetical protein
MQVQGKGDAPLLRNSCLLTKQLYFFLKSIAACTLKATGERRRSANGHLSREHAQGNDPALSSQLDKTLT